jgi:integrase
VSNFRKTVWLPTVGECGLEGLRVHDLRHTCASLAISAGASVKAVQRMLGHASATVTLDTYAALFTDDLEALADRLDERFGEAGVAQAWPKPSQTVTELASRNG